ncbi:HAD-like domain-containing protein [Trametes elegans]|nr:HAD-like domain-containing protein [Trametes elegans]
MAEEWLGRVRSRYGRGPSAAPVSVTLDSLDCLHRPSARPTSPSTLPLSSHLLAALDILLQAALPGVGLTHMNSLSYLSRQFDVLASPRTPPSTPTSESAPLLCDGEQHTRLKRSGSTRSFLVPQPSSSAGGWTLKRSYSSPAEVNPGVPSCSSSSSTLPPSISRKSSRPPSRRPSVSADKANRPNGTSDSSLVRHLLFVRIIIQLWHALLAALRSLTRQRNAAAAVEEAVVDDNSDEEEKDTEDESRDEKPPLPAPPSVLLDSQQPPYQPAIPSPLSLSPPTPPSEKVPSVPIPSPAGDPDRRLPSLVSSRRPPAPSTLTPPNTARSRSVTPTHPTKQTPFHQPKTLVLDLDETLIHSTSRPIPSAGGSGLFGFGSRNKGAAYTVEVVLGGRSTLYHVYKRPFVDYFLRKVSPPDTTIRTFIETNQTILPQVSQWYTLVIFTASMQEYADPVIDWLDAGRGILGRRLFRESCTQLPNGSYTKDLSIIEADLSRVCLIDNSPVCYSINEGHRSLDHTANGIPIEGWTHDPHDEALLDLLPVLDSLRFTRDVRSVLGIRGFS